MDTVMGLPVRAFAIACQLEAGPGSHKKRGEHIGHEYQKTGIKGAQFRVCPPRVYRCSVVPHSRSIYQDISTNIRAGSKILMP